MSQVLIFNTIINVVVKDTRFQVYFI